MLHIVSILGFFSVAVAAAGLLVMMLIEGRGAILAALGVEPAMTVARAPRRRMRVRVLRAPEAMPATRRRVA